MIVTAPSLLDVPDFETILTRRKNAFVELFPTAEQDNWRNTLALESSPVTKLLEEAAYTELLLRGHINVIAQSNLIQFAKGEALDHAAAWYQVTRLTGESDERFRARLFYHIRALAGNGTHESYIAKALATHVRVKDVAAYRLAPGIVNVAIWIDDSITDESIKEKDIPAAKQTIRDTVLAAVQAQFSAEKTMLGIDVNVYEAKFHDVAVHAKVVVSNNAPADAQTKIAEALRASSASEAEFGKPLAASQIVAWLHLPVAGADFVEKVQLHSPNTDLIPAQDELWRITDVELELAYGT